MSVLPEGLHLLAYLSPDISMLNRMRAALLDSASVGTVLIRHALPLVRTTAVTIPLGLAGCGHAKCTGMLKRNG